MIDIEIEYILKMIIAHFSSIFIARVYIGWSRPIAQQIVSYCTHFNKNITEGSIPQIRIGWGDVLEEQKNVQQFTGRPNRDQF